MADALRRDGHAAFTPTLTGLGERSHLVSPDIGLETHVADVANVLVLEDLTDGLRRSSHPMTVAVWTPGETAALLSRLAEGASVATPARETIGLGRCARRLVTRAETEEGHPLAKLLFHIVTGPENPTRVALGMLVAKTAVAADHDVTVFFAGDAVSALRAETLDAANGVGTGSLREHFDALVAGGASLFGSAMSANARGIDGETLGGAVELVKPDRLVELIVGAEQVVTY